MVRRFLAAISMPLGSHGCFPYILGKTNFAVPMSNALKNHKPENMKVAYFCDGLASLLVIPVGFTSHVGAGWLAGLLGLLACWLACLLALLLSWRCLTKPTTRATQECILLKHFKITGIYRTTKIYLIILLKQHLNPNIHQPSEKTTLQT